MKKLEPTLLALILAAFAILTSRASAADEIIIRPSSSSPAASASSVAVKPRATVGAYYFDGWGGRNRLADTAPWAKGMPTHMTKRMLDEFPDREPLWGWRGDSQAVMEQEIDLAADSGLSFFAFCWYFKADPAVVRADSKNDCVERFLKAKNNSRLSFTLLVANHAPFELKTTADWEAAIKMWLPYLKSPRCQRVGGKPLLILFKTNPADKAGLALLQDAARKAGLPGVAIALCGFGPSSLYGYTTRYNVNGGWEKGFERHRYPELMANHKKSWAGTLTQPHIPCVASGFDRRPWEENKNGRFCWYYVEGTPDLFAENVKDAIKWMEANPYKSTAEKLMIVYAWNELGEGGYLMPTKGEPQGKYLKALKEVLLPAKP